MPRRDARRDKGKGSRFQLHTVLLGAVSIVACVILITASLQLGDVESRKAQNHERLLGALSQEREESRWQGPGLGSAAAEAPVVAETPAVGPVQEAASKTAKSDEATEAKGESGGRIMWKLHKRKSCQGYAKDDSTERTLEASKVACLENDGCVAVECPHGSDHQCTLRANSNLIHYDQTDCHEQLELGADGKVMTIRVHPMYNSLLKEYPFQQVSTQYGQQVNIILVRSHMSGHQCSLYEKYKDEILFMGISSMNDYPLNSEGKTCPGHKDYVSLFPGFLHMMREPEKEFPPHVKTLLMSQSDFSLPTYPARDYSVQKKYDFTYSASDCDVYSDCKGWCGWSKNWSFVKQSLEVMCNPPYNLKGVLVATKDKANRKACSIPKACKGKMTQTTYLANQRDYFNYLKQSRFAFLPQIHDASPRVSTQALALDVPILMNYYIMGGWKYVNEQTGEFFHDMSDFKQQLDKILKGADTPGTYEPRKWVLSNYDSPNSGKRLLEFVQQNFAHRVKLPKSTKGLYT